MKPSSDHLKTLAEAATRLRLARENAEDSRRLADAKVREADAADMEVMSREAAFAEALAAMGDL